ncbi:MAG TPA: alpha/beta hydrolase [Solirubrobacteraceae bacterium]|nr:alpha/beta hydrolase [Solirubrobacteraceae bacterium]
MAATPVPGRDTPSRARSRRCAPIVAAVLLAALVLLAVLAAISWHFSSEVVVPDRPPQHPDATAKAVSPGRVVLSRSDDTLRPGLYGLKWSGGHAIVEAVVARSGNTVTRTLRSLRGLLAPGAKVALTTNPYEGNPRQALGLPFANVAVPDELGPMPAWLVPARTHTWTVVVHGVNSDREDNLRIVPTLHGAGSPTLLIDYREDVAAPRSLDGLHHMGLTEWRDLQAAAAYALAHGARRLILAGYSMGGAIVTQFMERSPLARHVAGLVLDAPALDWKAILSFNAKEMGLPSFAADPVEWAVGMRIDADWHALDALDHTSVFHLPILLFHGTEDKLVPISLSDAFARSLPRWVTYYRVPGAEHVGSWNVDPALYGQRLAAFVTRLGG